VYAAKSSAAAEMGNGVEEPNPDILARYIPVVLTAEKLKIHRSSPDR
jgi:hypothetical protein